MTKAETIDYTIKLSRRKTMSIQVYRDSSVIVRAPNRSSLRRIKKYVEKNIDWIEAKQKEFAKLPPPKPKFNYKNGDKLKFLGQELELQTRLAIANNIEISGNELILNSTSLKPAQIKKIYDEWFKDEAYKTFISRFPHCQNLVEKLDIKFEGELTLRRMKSRWGSCSHDGHICLNINLISAPMECIDYVITHELCHLREHNHSKAFYKLMTATMPDWKARKKLLNSI